MFLSQSLNNCLVTLLGMCMFRTETCYLSIRSEWQMKSLSVIWKSASQCVQACWQLPICRTKVLWSGWIFVLSQHRGSCNLIRRRSDLQCNTALCSGVKKVLHQQLPSRSFPPHQPRQKHAWSSQLASGFCTCWFIKDTVTTPHECVVTITLTSQESTT